MWNSDLSTATMVAEPITGYAVGIKVSGLIEVLVDCPEIGRASCRERVLMPV